MDQWEAYCRKYELSCEMLVTGNHCMLRENASLVLFRGDLINNRLTFGFQERLSLMIVGSLKEELNT